MDKSNRYNTHFTTLPSILFYRAAFLSTNKLADLHTSLYPKMSSTSAHTTVPTTKATTNDNNAVQTPQKPSAQLEEDDEFEDFPVEGTYHFFGMSLRIS